MTDALAPYSSPDDRERRLDELTAAARGEIVEYGRSVGGRPLRAARIPSVAGSAPRVLCSANIHGPEFVGCEVALGLLGAVATDAQEAMQLRAAVELWVVPCINPDGYAATWDAEGQGRLAALRTNANGVDLNRNFPRPEGGPSILPGAGSDQPGDATYRGPSALSEPETAALDALFAAQHFVASANMHSFMGTVIPARVTDRPAFATYKRLAATLAAAQRSVRYRRLSTRIFDVFTGEQEDHQHHVHGCWSVCVESFPIVRSYRQHWRAPSTFWRFNPHDPTPWVDNDVPGLLAYFAAAAALDRPATTSSRTGS